MKATEFTSRIEVEAGKVDNGRIETLTGLRGIAALAVALGHMGNANMIPGFFGHGAEKLGVMIFFILSAYLMTMLYLHKDPAQNLRKYVLARVGRVFPLYLIIVLLSYVFYSGEPWWRYDFGGVWTFVSAVFMLQAPSELWAVPVEVQFYIVFLLFWISHAKGLFAKRSSLALLFAFSFLVAVFVTVTKVVLDFNISGLNLYLHFFLLGVASWVWQDKITALMCALRSSMGDLFFSFFLVFVVVVSFPDVFRALFGFHIPNRINPIPIFSMFFLFHAVRLRIGFLRILESRFLIFFGEISYGFYLIHHLVITAFLWWYPELSNLSAIVVVFSVTSLVATASFYFLELPAARIIRNI
ncbi:acyltransferase [Mangrovicoccus sp. HB161399]|uniref:acyltransferase family protein n=1 Tax=Mangrovicoccus sp. HB161399 TaxID=2720392 RepID=UPI001555DC3C|nr:acyltransferase [Mangrovicoccus sp. HB161399]